MNPDQTAPKGPYILQYRQPKYNDDRQMREQVTIIMDGGRGGGGGSSLWWFSIIINNQVMVVDRWTDINGLLTDLEAINLEILGTSDKTSHDFVHNMKVLRPGLEVIKSEFILKLKIKRNDWLLANP